MMLTILLFYGCNSTEQPGINIFNLFNQGRFSEAREQIYSLYKKHPGQKPEKKF